MADYRTVHWGGDDVESAVLCGFNIMESLDLIVGKVVATPQMVGRIIYAMPDEIRFDYVPEGVGFLRTAYLKMRPMPYESEIRLYSRDGSTVLRMISE